jgi:hypothetical protein
MSKSAHVLPNHGYVVRGASDFISLLQVHLRLLNEPEVTATTDEITVIANEVGIRFD